MPTAPEFAPPEQAALVLAKRLDGCWERYRAEQKRIRSEFADEYVHDLRVSIRRLIAAIEMGRAVVRQKKLKKARQLLKAHLDAFDTLRDTQVQLAMAEDLQEELPEIEPYCHHLREREKRLASRLKKRIREFRSAGLAQQVARLQAALLASDGLEIESVLWPAVDEAYMRVARRRLAIRPDETATIHRTRLSFKKFRYLVEGIYPLLASAPADLLRRLHDYQAAMGEIQDAEVGLQMLDDFIAAKGEGQLGVVRAKFEEMHQVRIEAFIGQVDRVETFWRSAPDKKFPWETRRHKTTAK